MLQRVLKGRESVIKATVKKYVMVEELKEVGHSSLVAIFHQFHCQFWCLRIQCGKMIHNRAYFFSGSKHMSWERIYIFHSITMQTMYAQQFGYWSPELSNSIPVSKSYLKSMHGGWKAQISFVIYYVCNILFQLLAFKQRFKQTQIQ